MILKIYNGEYSLQWDGIYYLALIDYPNIQEWELEKIAKFIAYEKLHKRQTEDHFSGTKFLCGLFQKRHRQGLLFNRLWD